MLLPMTAKRSDDWDRAADLRAIESTYRHYSESERQRIWDAHNAGYRRLAEDLREMVVARLRSSLARGVTRVLDLGCGTGDLAAERARLGAPVEWVGVDLRESAVEAARARFPDARFVTASADAVPEPSSTFDVIVAQVMLSSLPSRQMEAAVAREVARLLRPGGWLVWADIRYSNPANRAVHGVSARRIRSLFPGWETELVSAGLLPPLARRLGPMTPALYPVLAAIPPLRSHHVGRLRRPGTDGGSG